MNYAAIADVRELGLEMPDAKDFEVTPKLADASSIVDAFVGRPYRFAVAPSAMVVNDVRVPELVLPGPVSNVQSVVIDGAVIDPTAYNVEPWGLRLYRAGLKDSDGFPRAFSVLPLRRAPYGGQVVVTALFGYALPLSVLAAPAVPTLTPSSTGGTLATGTYAYLVSQVGTAPVAGESSPSVEVMANVTGPTGSVTVTFPTSGTWRVYGRTSGAEQLLATVVGAGWVDTGAVTPSGFPPPPFPPRVVRATALITAQLVRQRSQPTRDPSIVSVTLGEYKVQYQALGELLDTTGNPEADRLLANDRLVMVG